MLLALREGRSFTDMVSNWDVQHFSALARGRLLRRARRHPHGLLPRPADACWPAWLALGIPVAVGGVVLSLVCSAVAAGALLRLGGPWAAVAWLFAPPAVFTTVPYTESLFCAAAFWAWERARADRWAAAAVLAAAACTVRVSGLFLLGALAVMVLTSRGVGPARPGPAAGLAAAARRRDRRLRHLPARR